MKKIYTILSILALTAAFSAVCVEPAYAQDEKKEMRQTRKTMRQQKKELYQKSDKMVLQEAKKLEKEGWKTMSLPISKQLEITWERIFQYDSEGYPKFVYTTEQAVGSNFSAAQMQAENVAKVRIASNIAASVASLADVALANNEIAPSQAASLAKAIENAKVVVASKLGRVFTSESIYKVNKDTYTVRVTVLYDMRQAMTIAKESIMQDLKDESDANRQQLEQMLGMGRMIDQYELNNNE